MFDTSFSRDLSLLETGREFVTRYKKAVEKGIIKPPHANGSGPSSSQMEGEDMDVDDQQGTKAAKAPKKRIIRRGAAGASEEPAVAVDKEAAMPMLASACPGMYHLLFFNLCPTTSL